MKRTRTNNTRQTPTTAIKRFCRRCRGGDESKIKKCGGNKIFENGDCRLFDHRLGKTENAGRAIRRFCAFCRNADKQMIDDCPELHCRLWPFRLKTNS